MDRKLKIPTFSELINPLFKALKELGGSGNVNEIYEKVIELEKISDEILEIPQLEDGNQSKVAYNLAWARTYLKKFGAITNTSRSVWVINNKYTTYTEFDVKEVVDSVRALSKKSNVIGNIDYTDDNLTNDGVETPDEIKPWRERLENILLNMEPFAFERLSKLLLRECGFAQVEVTKTTGDGGIDGFGKFKMNGIISFNLAFQCKRYQGKVPPSDIRDFRGSMTTDIEKGLFITTGSYSRSAIEEASANGKKQIDLIDGEQFIDMLAKFEIGLKEVKDYVINEDFFNNI
jgi:restriction system protein